MIRVWKHIGDANAKLKEIIILTLSATMDAMKRIDEGSSSVEDIESVINELDGFKKQMDDVACDKDDPHVSKVALELERLVELLKVKSGIPSAESFAMRHKDLLVHEALNMRRSLDEIFAWLSAKHIREVATTFKELTKMKTSGGFETTKAFEKLEGDLIFTLATNSATIAIKSKTIGAEAFEDAKLKPRGMKLASLPSAVQERLWQITSELQAAADATA